MRILVLFLAFLLVVPVFASAAWVKCDDGRLGAREAVVNGSFQCMRESGDYKWVSLATVTTPQPVAQKTDYFKTAFSTAFAITCNIICPACCAPLLKTIY